jgi:ubiquinone biosynthesis accessory factor UbiJ
MYAEPAKEPFALWALESTINAYVSMDEWSLKRLSALEGKLIQLHLGGIKAPIYIRPGVHGMALSLHSMLKPDTSISGSPMTLLGMGLGTHSGGLFAGDISIQGDVELGQEFRSILDHIEIDWEEHLSHLVGDVMAYQIAYHARGVSKWFKRTSRVLWRNSAEYLQTETHLTPSRIEVDSWMDQVDVLKANVDRIEARIKLMQKHS